MEKIITTVVNDMIQKIEEENNSVIIDGNFLIFSCPYCREYIIVNKNEINCTIFRHGVFKNNFSQLPPHSSKTLCDSVFLNNEIYGCGKPFKIKNNNIEKCNYI